MAITFAVFLEQPQSFVLTDPESLLWLPFPAKKMYGVKAWKKNPPDVHMPNFRIWFECGQNMVSPTVLSVIWKPFDHSEQTRKKRRQETFVLSFTMHHFCISYHRVKSPFKSYN